MSTTTHQLLLPGQAAAHPGPVDMNIMYVMHRGFRRDLDLFVAAAHATPVTDRDTWRRLADRWGVFAAILHNHHQGEDAALWPFLMERAEGADRATLEAMEAEHAEIDPILAACAAGLEQLAGHADEDARRALVVRLSAARERLGAHLAHEESDAIALIQRVMTQEEWEEVDQAFKEHLTPRLLLQIVPWGLSGLPAEATQWLYGQPGGAAYRLVGLLTRRGFARRERLAFRHVAEMG
jgi:hemerythrin-like domain-containing protein